MNFNFNIFVKNTEVRNFEENGNFNVLGSFFLDIVKEIDLKGNILKVVVFKNEIVLDIFKII